MREYILKDKIKYRIRFSIDKIPYKKRVKGPRIFRAERLFNESVKYRNNILLNKALFSPKMADKRIEGIYNCEDFKKISKNGSEIRKIEVLKYFAFALSTSITALLCLAASFYWDNYLYFLFVVPLTLLYSIILKAKIPFKKFYREIYLPICYHCANVVDESEGLTFEVYDKKYNWDKKFSNKKVITNRFNVFAKNVTAHVEKMLVRNNITTYSMRRGRIHIGKRLATIFSGYSFEMNFENDIPNPDEIKIAIINDDTFYGTDGLYKEDSAILKLTETQRIKIGPDWHIFINENFDFSEKDIREIKKKILMISHSIGIFNAYITGRTIRMMIGIKTSKDGFKEEKFQSQLKNPEKITYGGFYSITKTLYCIYCMKRFLKILYGKDFVIKTNRTLVTSSQKIKKKKVINAQEYKTLKKTGSSNIFKSIFKSKTLNKHAESTVSTAVKILITVVLGALVFAGFVKLTNDVYVNNTVSQTNSSFNENRNVLEIDDVE